MAPKKRKSSEVSPNRDLVIKPTSRTFENRRITRSLTIKGGVTTGSSSSPTTRRSSSASRKQTTTAAASKKKGKKPMKKPPQKKPKLTHKTDDDEDSDEAKSVSLDKSSDSDDDKKSAAAAAASDDDGDKNAATEAKAGEGGSSSAAKTTLIIEHCTQCQSFKKRANEARAGLEKSIPGVNVLINPDKPRRGCFEIRAEDGKAFVSLQDLKRPFKQMKDLDMDEVVANIAKEIGE